MINKLPHLDGPTVPTPWFDRGLDKATQTIRMRGIATFDGPSGTGKTTTATVAATKSKMRFVYAKLRNGARTRETAEALYKALHPHTRLPARANERNLIEECADTLQSGTVGIIADEVHRIGVPGMLLFSELWDTVKNETGRAFPLFLVGCNVSAAISSTQELDTRIYQRLEFNPLTPDDIIGVIQAMDARCAATPETRLLRTDQMFQRGNLRKWRIFMETVAQDPRRAGTEISVQEIQGFLVNQGVSLKATKLS